MPVEVSEGNKQFSSPLPDTSPSEPQSFIEAAHLHYEVREELAAIVASSSFRTSPKSCEFLRYVVEVTLDGRIDSLKERSIGMDLLGRDSSYDPNTDATVRVRAVEVRKRLTSFYATRSPVSGYRIELLPGSYMPRFVPTPKQFIPLGGSKGEVATGVQDATDPEQEYSVGPLNTLKMAYPALIALLLCALFLRQQIQSGDPYHQFWDKRLHGKSNMLLSIDNEQYPKTGADDDTSQALLPIAWLAGRYDLKLSIAQLQEMKNGNGQDPFEGNSAVVHFAEATPLLLEHDKRLRYSITSGQNASSLVDKLGSPEISASGEIALLTLLPERPSELWLTGTDWKAMNTLAEQVTSKRGFPSRLNFESESGRVVQVVWRGTPSPHLEIYTHQP
jgi:hypothetical protein